MLTRHDLRLTYKILKLASDHHIIPVTFDTLSGRMRCQSLDSSNRVFPLLLTIGLSHGLLMTLRTIQVGLFSDLGEILEDYIPLMIIMIGATSFSALTAYFLFFRDVVENAVVYNEILGIRGKN